jgi:chorismate synthase
MFCNTSVATIANSINRYGESHCKSVGVIIDGVPPLLSLTEADIQPQLDRRRPGQSAITTPRNEKDRVEIQSGTEHGVTLGTPIALRVLNEDQRPKDYRNSTINRFPRPSHADWTYQEKYGVRASSGGGRASARETIGRVAAGAVAEKSSPFCTASRSLHLLPPSALNSSSPQHLRTQPHRQTPNSSNCLTQSPARQWTPSLPCGVPTQKPQRAWKP